MSVAAKTREYLVLRISDLREDVKGMSVENGGALAIEFARIEELKNVLTILNGGTVPNFNMEVQNEIY